MMTEETTNTEQSCVAAGYPNERFIMPHVDASTIKPAKRGKADFFSWQLYRWVKAKPHAFQIWRGTWQPALIVKRPSSTSALWTRPKTASDGCMDVCCGTSACTGRNLTATHTAQGTTRSTGRRSRDSGGMSI